MYRRRAEPTAARAHEAALPSHRLHVVLTAPAEPGAGHPSERQLRASAEPGAGHLPEALAWNRPRDIPHRSRRPHDPQRPRTRDPANCLTRDTATCGQAHASTRDSTTPSDATPAVTTDTRSGTRDVGLTGEVDCPQWPDERLHRSQDGSSWSPRQNLNTPCMA